MSRGACTPIDTSKPYLSFTQPAVRSRCPELVDKASGVFLWVRLAVRELQKGRRNGQSLKLLQSLLHRLPADLDAFFLDMITSVAEPDREVSSRVFQIYANAEKPVTLMTMSYCENEPKDFAMTASFSTPLSPAFLALQNGATARRLNSLCMGLLEPMTPM